MILITHNNKYYTSYNKEKEYNGDDSNNEEPEESIPGIDNFDIKLLNLQATALLLLIYGYVLEYVSTLQGIEVIKLKYTDNNSENKPDPDITALAAAQYEVIAQSILLQISRIQYKNTPFHFSTGEVNIARSANFELLLSDAVELIAYLINLVGARKIYRLNNEEPIYGG